MHNDPSIAADRIISEKRWAASVLRYLDNNGAFSLETAICKSRIPNNKSHAVKNLVKSGKIIEIEGKWFLNKPESQPESLTRIAMYGLGKILGKSYTKAKKHIRSRR